LLKQKELFLQPAKARLQGMEFIVLYSSTMIVFIGHPLQPDLPTASRSELFFKMGYPIISRADFQLFS
jgi:hypothetical protein